MEKMNVRMETANVDIQAADLQVEKATADGAALHAKNAHDAATEYFDFEQQANEADAIADMSCLPSALEGRKYYEPKERGFEKEIKRRLDGWAEIKKKR